MDILDRILRRLRVNKWMVDNDVPRHLSGAAATASAAINAGKPEEVRYRLYKNLIESIHGDTRPRLLDAFEEKHPGFKDRFSREQVKDRGEEAFLKLFPELKDFYFHMKSLTPGVYVSEEDVHQGPGIRVSRLVIKPKPVIPTDLLVRAYASPKRNLVLVFLDADNDTYEFDTGRYTWLWDEPTLLNMVPRYRKEWLDNERVFDMPGQNKIDPSKENDVNPASRMRY